jgi:co-chaperonin GroES (HSP10)
MIVKPLPSFVVVKPVVAPKTTPSGIYLPESKGELTSIGEVISKGSAIIDQITVGSKVLFKHFSAQEMKTENGELLLLLLQEDILAVLEEK